MMLLGSGSSIGEGIGEGQDSVRFIKGVELFFAEIHFSFVEAAIQRILREGGVFFY